MKTSRRSSSAKIAFHSAVDEIMRASASLFAISTRKFLLSHCCWHSEVSAFKLLNSLLKCQSSPASRILDENVLSSRDRKRNKKNIPFAVPPNFVITKNKVDCESD